MKIFTDDKQELLNQNGINNIKSFMNVIFERIIKILSKYNIIPEKTFKLKPPLILNRK